MSSQPRRRLPAGVGAGLVASTTTATLLCGIAFVFGPVAIAAMVVTALVLARNDNRHWTEIVACGLGGAVAVAVVELVLKLNPLVLLYGGLVNFVTHFTLSPVDLVGDLVTGVPLAGSIGVALGAGMIGSAEACALGAEWHPMEQRFRRVESAREVARVHEAGADRVAQRACSSPPLGVSYDDGDLDALRDGAYITLAPVLQRCVGLAVVGAAGSGKTETIKRIVSILGWLDFNVVLGDWKGDYALIDDSIASFLTWRRDRAIRVHTFPEEPLNGWLGTPAQLTSRLLGVFRWNEPYYESATRSLLDWLVDKPCSSSDELLSRMTLTYLQKQTAQSPTAVAEFEALKNNRNILDGARLRLSGFFRALLGAYDGERSFSDSNMFVISIKALAARADAEAQMSILLNYVMQWATDSVLRPASGVKCALILDEFSEMAEVGAELVITMAERLRSAGVLIIVAAQSYEGLGIDDQQRERLLAALAGGLIVHACASPEAFCERAGTLRVPEQSWQLDTTTHSGMGSMREGYRMKLRPDDVRQARTGEAWIISQGRYSHLQVLRAETVVTLAQAQALHRSSCDRGDRFRTYASTDDSPHVSHPPSFLNDL